MSLRDYSRRLFCNIKWWGLRCNPSCLCSSTDTGLFTRFMPTKYHHLPASVCLPICLLCSCDCMCERTAHTRIQEFLLGGGGSRPDCQKTVLTCFFFYSSTYFRFYRGCQMVISKKTIIFHGFRGGGATFVRGSNFFQWGGGGEEGSKC